MLPALCFVVVKTESREESGTVEEHWGVGVGGWIWGGAGGGRRLILQIK